MYNSTQPTSWTLILETMRAATINFVCIPKLSSIHCSHVEVRGGTVGLSFQLCESHSEPTVLKIGLVTHLKHIEQKTRITIGLSYVFPIAFSKTNLL